MDGNCVTVDLKCGFFAMTNLLSELFSETTEITFNSDLERLSSICNESSHFPKRWHDDCC